ncbi:ABC transporter ATP-binding protein [uncultured Avibacterium sp.]|uniref:ABC transporter ATP-binding protein n=1 Tax=uncultured Avibacterium sp. TaxID=1936169 RepID=A0A486X926_9PAST|nr:ABC transporter ATP-binding protein [uncultured Avibacterium sp.]
MQFQLFERGDKFPSNARDLVCLTIDRWNDYSFVTMFFMNVFDHNGEQHSIGNIKIGFKGQEESIATYQKIQENFPDNVFDSLSDDFFSLGQDVDFYVNLMKLPNEIGKKILNRLNDIAYKPDILSRIQNESVLNTSLMRSVREQTITEQFTRVLNGNAPLSNFEFYFIRDEIEKMGEITLEFKVEANSQPSTNIHAIIGRNGVGKTTLLNGMIKSFIDMNDDYEGAFYARDPLAFFSSREFEKIGNNYFSHLVAVSFSVFDPFIPNNDDSKHYHYIGLKESNEKLKGTKKYFEDDFLKSFSLCKSLFAKRERWLKAIKNLESDNNFEEMNLSKFMNESFTEEDILKVVKRMSSGHASVLLIMTQLVATVEEKTLVLLDEPESHLHPPLLSAFIRALSNLLDNRNGVAIIATHSPVVLQEIPRSCVWKIERTGVITDPFRPKIETFGENVGILTSEIFGLKVEKSGFHRLLTESVNQGGTYEEILRSYNNQLGSEGRLLLKILIHLRDNKGEDL